MRVLAQSWLLASMALTAVAAILLVLFINPAQARALQALNTLAPAESVPKQLRQLAMTPGLFALLWVIVVVLMITRPGSSTS